MQGESSPVQVKEPYSSLYDYLHSDDTFQKKLNMPGKKFPREKGFLGGGGYLVEKMGLGMLLGKCLKRMCVTDKS